MRNVRLFVLAIAAGAILAGTPAHAGHSEPLFAEVALTPITINVTNYQDSPVRLDQAEAVSKLQSEATGRLATQLVNDGIAAHVVMIGVGADPPSGLPVISGSVSLPLSVPAKSQGMGAHDRYDWFAVADLVIHGKDGQILAQRHDPIRWKDVEWCRHSHNRAGLWHLVNRPLDDVLKDAVDGTVDRAVSRAANQIKQSTR